MATTRSGAATAPNVLPFEKSYNQTETHNNNNYNNNNTRARACEKIIEIHEAYEDVMGRAMPKFVEREIMAMINGGIEPDMVIAVLEYTACAPRPSWAYARTVLIRNEEKGITSSSAFIVSLANRGRAGDDALPY